MEGEKLRGKNLYEEALSEFEIALLVAPNVPSSGKLLSKCHLKRGWCFFNLGKHEDEIKEYTKALELNPTYKDALFDRAIAYEKLERFEDAIFDLKKVLQVESSEERAKIAILRLQRMAEEVQEIKKAGLGPAYEANLEGNKLFRKGLYNESLSKYENFMLALQAAPEMPSSEKMRTMCHYNRARCFYELKKYEDAIKESTNALELNPMYADALFKRAQALERLSQFEEAVTDVKKVLQMESSNERAKIAILRLKPMAEEVQEIKKAGLGQAYEANLKGNKLFGEGLYKESLSQYESFMLALQAAPEMPSSEKMRTTCHYNRAWCFYELKKYEDAIKESTNALELNPMYADALFERALALERLSQFEEAVTDFKKVLQMESSNERAKIAILRLKPMAEEVQEIKKAGLGQAYEANLKGNKLFGEGLYKDSLSQYESFMLALQAAPEMPSSEKMRTTCHYNRAWCFYELGNYEDAIKENTKALELNPTYQDALIERGLAHKKLGNNEMAIADMKKVLELDPSCAKAKNALLRWEPVEAGHQ